MRVTLTHRIELKPTKAQEELLRRAVGTARFAYNWALAEWERLHAAGERTSEISLRRELNAVKRELFPWMLQVPKAVPQQALKNLGSAFARFFEKKAKHPVFKKKGRSRDSARMDNGPGTFLLDGRRIRLPVIGWIGMREALRFEGRALSATVSRVASRWYVSVPVEVDLPEPVRENQAAVGVDLGVTVAAVLSTGERFPGPKALRSSLKRLRRLSRRHSHKRQGSANRKKSALKLARLHARIADLRREWCHQTTTRIARDFALIGIENLNVAGMLANRRLARAIADVGMYEFRRQLAYKAPMHGSRLVVADRFFPSSKLCSACGAVREELPLSVREWECACGARHDRDENAAKNLEKYARASCARSHACGEEGSGAAGQRRHETTPQRSRNRTESRLAMV